MTFELLSQLYIFENSTECSKISFDSDTFRMAKRSIAEKAIKPPVFTYHEAMSIFLGS